MRLLTLFVRRRNRRLSKRIRLRLQSGLRVLTSVFNNLSLVKNEDSIIYIFFKMVD